MRIAFQLDRFIYLFITEMFVVATFKRTIPFYRQFHGILAIDDVTPSSCPTDDLPVGAFTVLLVLSSGTGAQTTYRVRMRS